jgi:hypothetical protein
MDTVSLKEIIANNLCNEFLQTASILLETINSFLITIIYSKEGEKQDERRINFNKV